MHKLSETKQWHELVGQRQRFERLKIADLFAADASRQADLTFEAAGVRLDLSKNRLDRAVLTDLVALAAARGIDAARRAMFAGEHLNRTEDRAVLHVALRAAPERVIEVDGRNVVPDVWRERARAAALVDAVRNGDWKGFGGAPIRSVVNIGIGGSDLGPRMVTEALWPYRSDSIQVHFVANIDGADMANVLRQCDPATTLFIIASKSFTTAETMANAASARNWLLAAAGDRAAVARHFVALSTNLAATTEFGIGADNVFAFWDWVGGRFSLWSVIGMSIAMAIGNARFDELLAGARALDEHFEQTPLARNLPVLLGMVGIWYRNFFERGSHAILPYDHGLSSLPAYLQQAEMESNGKRVDLDGQPVGVDTAPVIWGGAGSNAQHAFFQLLHQGTEWLPADFILPLTPQHDLAGHHEALVANCLAQTEALLLGDPGADPHRHFPGNRPSTTLTVDRLTPARLGALIALYEHKIFVQGHIWGINSFDQFGVELGKRLARQLEPALAGDDSAGHDASTRALIREYRETKN